MPRAPRARYNAPALVIKSSGAVVRAAWRPLQRQRDCDLGTVTLSSGRKLE